MHIARDPTNSLSCFYCYLLCYVAVLINFTYYAHVKDLCLGIQYFAIKLDCFVYSLDINMVTVLLEYIDLWYSYFYPNASY